jgi:hypothetical protein
MTGYVEQADMHANKIAHMDLHALGNQSGEYTVA